MLLFMSKRLNLSLPEPIYEALEQWAEAEKRQPGNLASLLLEEKVRDEIASGRYPLQKIIERQRQQLTSQGNSPDVELFEQRDRAQAFIQSVLNGQEMATEALLELATDLGVEPSNLHIVQQRCKK